ncbi:hypothetical protein [Streptomyces sp. NPDC023838]|uniref:hypothetical protein n=1 Tax=Streptomyces sp. NPDC023838 TaxID=3154325 RepID=UPI0033D1C9F0
MTQPPADATRPARLRCGHLALPRTPKDLSISHVSLAEFAPALARWLPGLWSAGLHHHSGPDHRHARTDRVWTPFDERPSLARFEPVTDAVLTGPNGQGLYLLPHRAERVLVCPLIPDDLHEDITDRMLAPPCITVPASPARAAWRLQDRLLPYYLGALDSARRAQRAARTLAQPASLPHHFTPPPAGAVRGR